LFVISTAHLLADSFQETALFKRVNFLIYVLGISSFEILRKLDYSRNSEIYWLYNSASLFFASSTSGIMVNVLSKIEKFLKKWDTATKFINNGLTTYMY